MFYALKFLLVMVGILSGNLATLNILSAFSVSEIASKIIWCISSVVMIYNNVYTRAGRLRWGNMKKHHQQLENLRALLSIWCFLLNFLLCRLTLLTNEINLFSRMQFFRAVFKILRREDKPRTDTVKRSIIVQVYETLRIKIGSSTGLKSSV